MTEQDGTEHLEFHAELDEAPDKVWRAVTEPDLLAKWLPELAPSDGKTPIISAEPVFTEEGEEIHYRWHDIGLPEFDTYVVFDLRARDGGGTHLRITHELRPADTNTLKIRAANSNTTMLMRAA